MIIRSTDIKAALRSRQRGFLLNPFRFGGGGVDTDPYFSNVVLLLNFQGADGSTTIIDQSPLAQSLAISGAVTLTDEQSVFGGTSGSFGSGYLNFGTASGQPLGTSDFTIEAWVMLRSAVTSTQCIIDYRPNANGPYPTLDVDSGNFIYVANGAVAIRSSTVISPYTWYHIAIERYLSITKMYVQGGQEGSTLSDTTDYIVASGGRPFIGNDSFSTSQPLNGFIGAMRITKGVARYKGNFTVPLGLFPTS